MEKVAEKARIRDVRCICQLLSQEPFQKVTTAVYSTTANAVSILKLLALFLVS